MPSFIHTSRQSTGVTSLPYHWWTISWTITSGEVV